MGVQGFSGSGLVRTYGQMRSAHEPIIKARCKLKRASAEADAQKARRAMSVGAALN